jgi:hypothetical protein
MSKRFNLYVGIWSIFLLSVMIANFINRRNIVMCYSLLSQQILSWLILISYLAYTKFKAYSASFSKAAQLLILFISGPVLLTISVYCFLNKSNLDIEYYALSFITWWTLFSISVYCSFELTLDIALYYHRKKKAQYYDSIESSSGLIS